MINSIFLIVHEIDSAYWKEWELFGIPGGINVFLLLHFPMLFVILYGLVLLLSFSFAGLVISLIVSAGGIFAFYIHTYFIKKGRKEFKTPISMFILISTLALSIVQGLLTLYIMIL
jgi:hypothetical protein